MTTRLIPLQTLLQFEFKVIPLRIQCEVCLVDCCECLNHPPRAPADGSKVHILSVNAWCV